MGIDVFILDDLLDLRGRDLGDALCLGRQELHVTNDQAAPISSARWPGQDLAGLSQSDGYAETLLRKLGACSVQSTAQFRFTVHFGRPDGEALASGEGRCYIGGCRMHARRRGRARD